MKGRYREPNDCLLPLLSLGYLLAIEGMKTVVEKMKIDKRDNFSSSTRTALFHAALLTCSKCKRPTAARKKDADDGARKMGRAAHIEAASPEGKRYNPNMSPEQRKHISNGIWLCIECADEIDDDHQPYTVTVLQKIKADHESDVRNAFISNMKVSFSRSATNEWDKYLFDNWSHQINRRTLLRDAETIPHFYSQTGVVIGEDFIARLSGFAGSIGHIISTSHASSMMSSAMLEFNQICIDILGLIEESDSAPVKPGLPETVIWYQARDLFFYVVDTSEAHEKAWDVGAFIERKKNLMTFLLSALIESANKIIGIINNNQSNGPLVDNIKSDRPGIVFLGRLDMEYQGIEFYECILGLKLEEQSY